MSISRSLGKYKVVYSFDGIFNSSGNKQQTRAMFISVDEPAKNVMLRGKKSKSQKNSNGMMPFILSFKICKAILFQEAFFTV